MELPGFTILMHTKLGDGIYGKVFLGKRNKDSLPVAIKVVSVRKFEKSIAKMEQLEFEINVQLRKDIAHPFINRLLKAIVG